MFRIFFMLFLIFIGSANGQVRIIDSITNEVIVGANLYSKEGLSLGISDIYGNIDESVLKRSDLDTIIVQHLSYESKRTTFNDLVVSRLISLTPRKVLIDEVVVSNQNQSDYVVLKGYFRTYDLFKNKIRYFYDGIVEYYFH